jgi:hypothetical protein
MSFPDPVKFAESAAKFREHTLKLKAARHSTMVITDMIPPPPTVPASKRAAAAKCTARTLGGRQCPFNATCSGGFCKKHFSMK